MRKNTEATIYLFGKMWEYAKWNRFYLILYIFLSIIANLILLLEPIIFAVFINELQKNWITEYNIYYLIGILFLIFILVFIFRWIYGASRLLERNNAFFVKNQYKKYLLEKVLNFNISWHNDKQSWDSIDKIDKASGALFDFCQWSYKKISFLVNAIWIIIALSFFHVWIAIWVFILVGLVLFLIYLFDKKLIPQYKKSIVQKIISPQKCMTVYQT